MIARPTGDGFHGKLNKVVAARGAHFEHQNTQIISKEVKYLKMKTQLIQVKSLSEFQSC